MTVEMLTDNAAMLKVREGEVERLGLLFERHSARLFNFFVRLTSSRETSEDLVQEVFFRILRHRRTFRDTGDFKTWMYRIAHNTHVDWLRKKRPEIVIEDEERLQRLDGARVDRNPELELQTIQEAGLVAKALAQLPADKRELLVLCRVEQIAHRRVAEILSCNPVSVRVRLHRALEDLRGAFFKLAQERST